MVEQQAINLFITVPRMRVPPPRWRAERPAERNLGACPELGRSLHADDGHRHGDRRRPRERAPVLCAAPSP